MSALPEEFEEFSKLVGQHRPREAFVLFLEQTENTSWQQLSASELAMLDTLCQHTLLELREQHTLWMVNHPDRLRRILKLLTDALAVNYRRAATIDHIAWLRCLLAITQAMTCRIENVHKELCLVDRGPEAGPVPEPNGILHQQIRLQSLAPHDRGLSQLCVLPSPVSSRLALPSS